MALQEAYTPRLSTAYPNRCDELMDGNRDDVKEVVLELSSP